MIQRESLPFKQEVMITRLRKAASTQSGVAPADIEETEACRALVEKGYARMLDEGRTSPRFALRGAIIAG